MGADKANSKYAYAIVGSAFLMEMAMLMALQGIPMMLGYIKEDLALTGVEMGSITSVFQLFYSGLAFVWGFVSDKLGVRRTVGIAFVFAIVGMICLGLFGASYITVALFYAMVGVGCAAFTAATVPKLMSRWFVTSKRGTPAAVAMTGGTFCGMILGVAVPQMVLAIGWHGTLVALGCCMVVIAIVFLVVVRDDPADKGLLPYGARSEADIEVAPAREKGDTLRKYAVMFKMAFTYEYCVHAILYQMAYTTINSFLTVGLIASGMDVVMAGFVLSVYNIFQIIGSWIFGVISDRMQPKMALFTALVIWVVGCVALVVTYGNVALSFVSVAIMGLGLAVPALHMGILSRYYPSEIAGAASGITQTISVIGRTAGPIVAGVVIDANGGSYVSAFVFAAICMFVTTFIPLLWKKIDMGSKGGSAAAE